MKDDKIPSHRVDVAEIMKKIRQSAANSRTELTLEEKVRREAKSEFLTMMQNAEVADFLVEEIRQRTVFEPYDPRTLYVSSRSGVGSLIGLLRRILKPITKLFVNLDPLAHQVYRLTVLNNLYLKTIQDLVAKTSALRVEMYSMKKRFGHHRSENPSRYGNQGQNHRRFSRDRHGRRESHHQDARNMNPRSGARPNPIEEPQT
jgi:hypothetical protein